MPLLNASTSGSQSWVESRAGYYPFRLTCSNAAGSTSRAVTVTVGQLKLDPAPCFNCQLQGPGTVTRAATGDDSSAVVKPVRAAKMGAQTPVEAAELAIIRRKTYQLAGQTIAVRVQVVGDREAAENGFYYVHSDHLGSVHILTRHSDGYVEAGSLARYEPFGDWRTEPTTNPTISDRGFTGHYENRQLGLTYMQARFYVPCVNGHSADIFDDQMLTFSLVKNNRLTQCASTGSLSPLSPFLVGAGAGIWCVNSLTTGA